MKLFLTILIFLLLSEAYSQEADSLLFNNKINLKSFEFEPTIDFKYQFNVHKIDFKYFNVYTKITGLNDIYLGFENNSPTYTKSIFIEENQYRGFKKDSFNPMGLSTNTPSLATGLLNFAINKLK